MPGTSILALMPIVVMPQFGFRRPSAARGKQNHAEKMKKSVHVMMRLCYARNSTNA